MKNQCSGGENCIAPDINKRYIKFFIRFQSTELRFKCFPNRERILSSDDWKNIRWHVGMKNCVIRFTYFFTVE